MSTSPPPPPPLRPHQAPPPPSGCQSSQRPPASPSSSPPPHPPSPWPVPAQGRVRAQPAAADHVTATPSAPVSPPRPPTGVVRPPACADDGPELRRERQATKGQTLAHHPRHLGRQQLTTGSRSAHPVWGPMPRQPGGWPPPATWRPLRAGPPPVATPGITARQCQKRGAHTGGHCRHMAAPTGKGRQRRR